MFDTDRLSAALDDVDEVKIDFQKVSGTKDTYRTLSSANNFISVAATKSI